jgi:hypothetical protein
MKKTILYAFLTAAVYLEQYHAKEPISLAEASITQILWTYQPMNCSHLMKKPP